MKSLNSKSSYFELILIVVLFLISLINTPLLIVSVLLSFILLRQKEMGLIKLLYLYTIRFVVSSGIDHAQSGTIINIIRYFLIYVCGIVFVAKSFKSWSNNKIVSLFITMTFILMIFLLIPNILVSNYTVVATFKLINYIIPLTIVVILVSQIANLNELINWIANQFKFLIVFSLLFVKTSIGYLLNGFSFQGVLNHPNLFAVLLSMGLIVIMVSLYKDSSKFNLNILILVVGLYELVLSNSRTAVISFLVIMLIFFLLIKIKLYKKVLIILIGTILIVSAFMVPIFQSKIMEFIEKGQSSDKVLLSRYGQINNFEISLREYPLFGNGFGIPINNTSLSLNNYTFEAGNIIFGLIIFTGIVGLVIYAVYLISIIFIAKKPFRVTITLFLITILVNMGEMIMFSSTNVGLICYILWGIYLKEGAFTQYEKHL